MNQRSDSDQVADDDAAGAIEEGEEGNREHFPMEHARRAASLLFLGASIAIVGLLFSLSMVIFRATCDSDFKLATHFSKEDFPNLTADQRLCKTSPIGGEPIPMDRLGDKHLDGMVSIVNWKSCTTNEDCKQFSRGFCAGGLPGNNSDEDFCNQHDCLCRAIIWDCGLNQAFKMMNLRLGDYVRDCDAEFCDEEVNVTIPKWTLYRSDFIGCESKLPTTLKQAMAEVQKVVEVHGISQPLKRSNDTIWSDLRSNLKHTINLEFGYFWPSTISESVACPWSPEQTIFVGFMVCAALSLFRSDYTSECKRVNLAHKQVPFLGFEWNTVRAWLPPLGLIVLSMVEMKPFSEIYNFPDGLMTAVHLAGAQFCFVVYLQAEFAALADEANRKALEGTTELVLRFVLNALGFASMGIFALSYGIVACASGKGKNPYVRPPLGGACDLYIRHPHLAYSTLVRPAGDTIQALKVVSYCAEFMVALSILISHLVIWYSFSARVMQRWKSQLEQRSE